MISGRTQSIISRFPRFYSPDDPESLFFQLLEVFGDTLDQAEKDLMQVLRSHFVGTAENIDSQGFTGKHKGDLDRIFAFYLEQLGGTSQLSQVNPQLQVSEFKQLDELLKILLKARYEQEKKQSLTAYLYQKLSPNTQNLLQCYTVENTRFKEELDYPGQEQLIADWLLNLLSRQDSLSQYLQQSFSHTVQALLAKYDGSVPVPLEMKKAIALHLNQAILPNPLFALQVLRYHQELSAQVTCLQTLINSAKSQDINTIQRKVGNFLLPRLSPGLQIALADSQTESQLQALYLSLTSELRPQLQSPRLATQICQQLKYSQTPDSTLTKAGYVILWQAVRTALAEVLAELVEGGQQWLIWVELLRRYEQAGQRSQIKDIPDLPNLQSPLLPFLQSLLQRSEVCRHLENIAQEVDFIATDSTLLGKTCQEIQEIVSEFTQATISQFYTTEENLAIANQVRVILAQFLMGGISKTLTPTETSQDLPPQLREKLKKLFADPTNCQQLLTLFEQVEAKALPPHQKEISHLLGALISASQTILRNLLNTKLQHKLSQLQLAPDLQTMINQKPSGEHLERLNRQLLEAVFPVEIPRSQIPASSEIAQALAQDFNEVLKDPTFYNQHKDFFSQLSLSLTTQNFIQDYQNEKAGGKGASSRGVPEETSFSPLPPDPHPLPIERLIFLNRLLLESAYPRQIERCDTPYRERLKRLIGVLKNGASPTEGIIEIVAANLGMNTDPKQPIKPWEEYLFDLPSDIETHLNSLTASTGLQKAFKDCNVTLSVETTVLMEEWMQVWVLSDGPRGQVYRLRRHNAGFSVHRQLIRVIEYQAGSQKQQFTVHPNPSDNLTKSTFILNNPSASIETPTLELTLKDSRLGSKERELPHFKLLRITNQTNNQSIQYASQNMNQMVKIGELMRFSADGSVLKGGSAVSNSNLSGNLPSLPIGDSTWCIEAEIDLEETKFDQSNLDFARFGSEPEQKSLQTPQIDCYGITISLIRQQLVYGSFTVKIPWDIPNYTDRFNEKKDHPRHQIHSLIDKVRAAGIAFSIIYEKFPEVEDHEIEDTLEITRIASEVKQKKLYEEQSSNAIEHQMSDTLILAQMFDYTYFDSLNTFA
ncbi:hypothetical protein [Nostoc sp. ChiQUE01b]|uniref:hypothetical protein n=1 Tax=Nostoc sp. ChiQUE01b TaxID=3075376 RepID=UPI002AD5466E|nr:hypothetical protein [Nostoc sp. ChiQUE01b]MDZ8263316.1 hypothetical protein [Nostoc sp. ChiQUE01b]